MELRFTELLSGWLVYMQQNWQRKQGTIKNNMRRSRRSSNNNNWIWIGKIIQHHKSKYWDKASDILDMVSMWNGACKFSSQLYPDIFTFQQIFIEYRTKQREIMIWSLLMFYIFRSSISNIQNISGKFKISIFSE